MQVYDLDLVSGSGGGGKRDSGRTPVNEEDNLNSVATGKLLDVLSEGEIAGFATPFENDIATTDSTYQTEGQKDIFFNKTPLLKASADSSNVTASDYNFNVDNLTTEANEGTASQDTISGFSKVRSVVPAFPNDDLTDAGSEKILSDGLSDTNGARITEVVVNVGVPSLFVTNNKGDVTGANLRFLIFRTVDDVTTQVGNVLVHGRTNDLYQIQKTIPIPKASNTNARNITITVRKFNSPPSGGNLIQVGNSIRFMSAIKVIDQNLPYPNTALVGLNIDAENFSSVPKRTYLLKGIKIRIPHNTTVDKQTGRIIYDSGYVFDGSMQEAKFCACPVFVLYDILTSKRYGFGDQILTPAEKVTFNGSAQNIDLFSFVEASKYANTLVSDRRTNPTSISGDYTQSGRTVTITFTANSGFQKRDVVTCDFTSGSAVDFSGRIITVKQDKKVITLRATNSATNSGNVTVTKGNTEPRFSFNGVINRQEDAFKLLNKVASVFRGAVYFSEGKIKLTCDKPADSVYLFNRSNVTQEGFSYEGSDVKTRSNCVVVRFFNNVTQQIDYVQHPLASNLDTDPFVTKYGLNKKQIDAFGCTSGGQASRFARFIYFSENFLTETCTFTTTSDAGVMVKPGMVISISDPVRSGTRLAGRITAASTSQITVDSISGISFSSGDKLSVILGNGNMETKDVSGISGSVITVSSVFTSAPNINSVWLYEKTTVAPSTWRIISIQQAQNLQYTITAVTYNSSLYNTIEGGTDVEAKDITTLDEKVDSPSDVTIRESLYKHVPNKDTFATNNGNIRVQLRATWPSVNGAVKYKVSYTKGEDADNQDNPVDVIVRRNEFELRNVEAGNLYVFSVQSINAAGLLSTVPFVKTMDAPVVGKSAPPSNVASLSATIDPNDGVGLNWVPVTPLQSNGFADLDLAGYEVRKGTVWDNGTHPETGTSGSGIRVQATNLFLPVEFVQVTSTFMVKAYDTSGNFSTTATSATVTINSPSAIVNPIQPSPLPSPLDTGTVLTGENGIIKIRWNKPETHTYKIKNYKIAFNDGSEKIIFADNTEFQTPNAWAGSSRSFVISAVDIAGNEGTTTSVSVTIPKPAAPNNLTHSFTIDSVVLKWQEAASAGALQPPVIGYRIFRNNGTTSIAQIKGTEFTLLVNNTNFPSLTTSYQVAAVYADPAFPTDGKPSTNQATRSITITNAASPPNQGFSFELDFVRIKWGEVNGSLKTIRYGIFDNEGDLIGEADSREFTLKADFDTKTIQIRAFSAAYINTGGLSLFSGVGSDLTITRQNLSAPESGSFVLGSEGGLGFVTTKWTTPNVVAANNLAFKDFKIIRSSSNTLSAALNNIELSVIQDTESFKEEVSWKVTGQNNSITKYYYIIPRDLLNNEGTALRIEVEIFRPSTVPASGTCEVIDNNVLLRWGEPSVNAANQLKIDHYEIRKHTGSGASSQVWSTSSPIGKGAGETITDSRFSVVFETVAGTFTYLIKAYDTAGNETKDSEIFFKSLEVAQPPDFILNADYDSVFSTSSTGLTSPQEVDSVAFTNCLKVFDIALNKNVLYLPVLSNSSGVGTQTWQEHFVGTGSNASPQFANISAIQSAGFSDYLEPAPTGDSGKGEYQEVFDFGTNLASSRVATLAEFANQGSGTVNQSQRIDLASGGSGGTFSDGTESNTSAAQRFGVGFQRVRYKTRAISVAGSLTKITNLNLKIDVKIKNDTGIGTANASDSIVIDGVTKQGTTVNFNVNFVDVQGIAVTPNTTSAVIAVVDFQDIPNPTSFRVLLYNTSGVRVSGNFTWQCRGT